MVYLDCDDQVNHPTQTMETVVLFQFYGHLGNTDLTTRFHDSRLLALSSLLAAAPPALTLPPASQGKDILLSFSKQRNFLGMRTLLLLLDCLLMNSP